MIEKETMLAEIEKRREEIFATEVGDVQYQLLQHGRLSALDWMENVVKSMPNEEGCDELSEEIVHLSKCFPEVSFAKLSRIAVRVAKWQKQQIMKEAVNATVCGVGSREGSIMKAATYQVCEDVPNNEIGDEVKLIIIKED